jgi:hypothetical protein
MAIISKALPTLSNPTNKRFVGGNAIRISFWKCNKQNPYSPPDPL